MELLVPVSCRSETIESSVTNLNCYYTSPRDWDQKMETQQGFEQERPLILTLEEHSVDNHGSVRVLHILGDLRQLAIGRLGRPLVDGVHRAPLVPEVDFRVVVVVVLLAGLHKLVSEGDGAGAVEAVVDLPGGVALLGVAHLRKGHK